MQLQIVKMFFFLKYSSQILRPMPERFLLLSPPIPPQFTLPQFRLSQPIPPPEVLSSAQPGQSNVASFGGLGIRSNFAANGALNDALSGANGGANGGLNGGANGGANGGLGGVSNDGLGGANGAFNGGLNDGFNDGFNDGYDIDAYDIYGYEMNNTCMLYI